MQLKPVSDHIILKPIDRETTTASGIIIPDTVDKDRPEQGKVLSVGPGKFTDDGKRQPVDIHPGQKVLFKKYAPDEFEVDGATYLVIKADDVIAIVE